MLHRNGNRTHFFSSFKSCTPSQPLSSSSSSPAFFAFCFDDFFVFASSFNDFVLVFALTFFNGRFSCSGLCFRFPSFFADGFSELGLTSTNGTGAACLFFARLPIAFSFSEESEVLQKETSWLDFKIFRYPNSEILSRASRVFFGRS